jgi:two-component system response regulator AtoC
LAELEKRYILEVLESTRGNKSKTAEILGISRAALWRKLKQFKKESAAP